MDGADNVFVADGTPGYPDVWLADGWGVTPNGSGDGFGLMLGTAPKARTGPQGHWPATQVRNSRTLY